jgi:mxaD protein
MKSAVIFALAFFSASALAHGPTPQKVVESIEINAPVDKVWAVAGQFSGISKWNPALKASEGGNKQGDKRTLTFNNGEQVTEELDAIDEAAHEYTYRLAKDNVKAIPASSYSAIFRVIPVGQGVKVEWKSRLYRGDTGNFPSDDMNDEAAVKAMTAFFKNGLERLKVRLESGGS